MCRVLAVENLTRVTLLTNEVVVERYASVLLGVRPLLHVVDGRMLTRLHEVAHILLLLGKLLLLTPVMGLLRAAARLKCCASRLHTGTKGSLLGADASCVVPALCCVVASDYSAGCYLRRVSMRMRCRRPVMTVRASCHQI